MTAVTSKRKKKFISQTFFFLNATMRKEDKKLKFIENSVWMKTA